LRRRSRSRFRSWPRCRRRVRGTGTIPRLPLANVEQLMAERPDATLEAALEVFEVFASGSLTDEIYILDDVGGKRIAIAPTAVKNKYRRG
jgi:hypothetical protein